MDRFVLAHELGHLAHNHIWKSIGWYALFAFPVAFLIARATRRRGGMGVPEAVPLAIFVYVVLQLVALPLQNVDHPPHGGGGRLVGAPRDARPARGRAALPALRLADAGGPEPAVVGLRLPREPPDADAADRDGAGWKRYAAAQSP